MEEQELQRAKEFLEGLAKGAIGHEIDELILANLEIVEISRGLLRCRISVTNRVSDGDGNWHFGAMAALIDVAGAVAVHSATGESHVSIDLNFSAYATVRNNEEVEVVAKVVANNGRLKSAVIKVRRRYGGDIIALGRLWMAPVNNALKNLPSGSKL